MGRRCAWIAVAGWGNCLSFREAVRRDYAGYFHTGTDCGHAGEWTLKISFAYVCDEARSHFKVCASYESPSEEDINWLRKARLREHDAGIRPETKGGAADFELTDDGKKFLEYICKTVNDFERTDKKDEAFWRDFSCFWHILVYGRTRRKLSKFPVRIWDLMNRW